MSKYKYPLMTYIVWLLLIIFTYSISLLISFEYTKQIFDTNFWDELCEEIAKYCYKNLHNNK